MKRHGSWKVEMYRVHDWDRGTVYYTRHLTRALKLVGRLGDDVTMFARLSPWESMRYRLSDGGLSRMDETVNHWREDGTWERVLNKRHGRLAYHRGFVYSPMIVIGCSDAPLKVRGYDDWYRYSVGVGHLHRYGRFEDEVIQGEAA